MFVLCQFLEEVSIVGFECTTQLLVSVVVAATGHTAPIECTQLKPLLQERKTKSHVELLTFQLENKLWIYNCLVRVGGQVGYTCQSGHHV